MKPERLQNFENVKEMGKTKIQHGLYLKINHWKF